MILLILWPTLFGAFRVRGVRSLPAHAYLLVTHACEQISHFAIVGAAFYGKCLSLLLQVQIVVVITEFEVGEFCEFILRRQFVLGVKADFHY